MVRSDGGAGSHVALPHYHRCDEKGIVVMLFMCRKYEVIQDFTAGYGGIVAQERVDKPGPVFQVGIVAQDEFNRLASVKNVTAITDDAVHKFHTFAYLGGLFHGRIDGKVF